MSENVLEAAIKVANLLATQCGQYLPNEVLSLDNGMAAIVIDVDGVDYIMAMQRVPRQRPRPAVI